MSRFASPTLLTEVHNVSTFDCGVDALNSFLRRHALQNQRNNSARTFVATLKDSSDPVGFYSLCASSIAYEYTPERIRKGLARHDVPVILLARLAVDIRHKGVGLGASLLLDAFRRCLTAQEVIGARALLAHAKDSSAKAFYERWGFVATEDMPFHLYLLTKDVRHSVESLTTEDQHSR